MTSIRNKRRHEQLAIDRLSVIWKSNLSHKIKHTFSHAAVVSILLYECTTWTLTKLIEKKLDGNCTRMLRGILNTSWKLHTTKQQQYSHLPLISKPIPIRRTRHTGYCWWSKGKLINDVFQWTLPRGRASVWKLVKTYLQQFCTDTRCSQEDLPEATDDRDK